MAFTFATILTAAKRDPNGFIAGLNSPVTLDGVQHVPESSVQSFSHIRS